jgi:hypothetical protein
LCVAACCAALFFAACAPSASPTTPSATGATSPFRASQVADETDNQAQELVPLKGTLKGQYGTTTGQPPLLHEIITAGGRATHLGQYALTIEETVDLTRARATGTFTFIAANGDSVFGTFEGQAELGAEIRITEEAQIRGGTGRFAGAQGTFTIHRTLDPTAIPPSTVGSFEGTISAPGSARP